MATYETARSAAIKRATDNFETVYVVKDLSCDEDPAQCYFAADDSAMDTYYAGLKPLLAVEGNGTIDEPGAVSQGFTWQGAD